MYTEANFPKDLASAAEKIAEGSDFLNSEDFEKVCSVPQLVAGS